MGGTLTNRYHHSSRSCGFCRKCFVSHACSPSVFTFAVQFPPRSAVCSACPFRASCQDKKDDWLESGGDSGLGYVAADAEEDIDGLPLEQEDLPDVLGQEPSIMPSMEETVIPRPARARKPAKATALGPGRPPPAEKRPTVASVAGSFRS